MTTPLKQQILDFVERDLEVADIIQFAIDNPGSLQLVEVPNHYHQMIVTDIVKKCARRWLSRESYGWTSDGIGIRFPLGRQSTVIVTDDPHRVSAHEGPVDRVVQYELEACLDLIGGHATVADALMERRRVGTLEKLDDPLVMMAKALVAVVEGNEDGLAKSTLDIVMPGWEEHFWPERPDEPGY